MLKTARHSPLRQAQRDAVCEILVNAAEHIINHKGYEQATMQQIAGQARCAAGTLYLYFKTKEDLFNAMAAKHAQALTSALLAAMEHSDDPVEKLRLSNEAHFTYMRKHPGFFRIFFTSAPGGRATFQASLRGRAWEVYSEYRRCEIDIVRAGQRAGRIRRDLPAEELVDFSHGLSLTACARWITTPKAPAHSQQVWMLWEGTKGILGVTELHPPTEGTPR